MRVRPRAVLALALGVSALVIAGCYWLLQQAHPESEAEPALSPAAYTNSGPLQAILYCIASVSVADRLDTIEVLLDHALDWCEAGHATKVVIDTYLDPTLDYDALLDGLREERRCLANNLQIEIIPHARVQNEHMLMVFHREHFQRHLTQRDLFVFGEDDMEIRIATVRTWLHETDRLWAVQRDAMVGLMRFENAMATLRAPRKKLRGLWREVPGFSLRENTTADGALSVPRNRVTWDMSMHRTVLVNSSSAPRLSPAAGHNRYVRFVGNSTALVFPYAAAGMFTRVHLEVLEARCGFLSHQAIMHDYLESGRPFYTSYQPFTCGPQEVYFKELGPGGTRVPGRARVDTAESRCCMEWLLPVRHFAPLVLHHMGSPGGPVAEGKWPAAPRVHGSAFLRAWSQWFEAMLTEAEAQ